MTAPRTPGDTPDRAPDGAPGRAGVVVQASLDHITSADVRFLQEAARLGPLHVRIPSDALVERQTGSPPRFPVAERRFLAESLRCVDSVSVVDEPAAAVAADLAGRFGAIVVRDDADAPTTRTAAEAHGLPATVLGAGDLAGFPAWETEVQEVRPPEPGDPPRVIVTGCYDWLHSGHVRFFMDAAALGDLYVVVGSDHNVELLKGPGHPLQHEEERRYMVGAVRSVTRCLVSSGSGWMDAAPEVARIRPSVYVVNEDGDQPAKREFCLEHGIDYVVLRRLPHPGLPARSSTDLRGF